MTSLSMTADEPDLPPVAARAHEDGQIALARTDPREFGPLYERHVATVYRYLRSRAHDEEAAELTSVTFERALASLHTYRGDGSGFLGWLLRIARNTAVDAERRRRPTIALEALPPHAHPVTAVSPAAATIASDDARRVRSPVARLPPLQQDAIALRFAGGLTAREIAPVIGKSEAATQKLLTRALQTLKESLDGR